MGGPSPSLWDSVVSRVTARAKLSEVDTSVLVPGDILVRSMGPRRRQQESFRNRLEETLYRAGTPMLQGSWAHAVLYEGDGQVLESDDAGVVRAPIDEAIHSGATYAVFRAPEGADVEGALANARAQLGKPYSMNRVYAAGASTLLPVPVLRKLRNMLGEEGPICSSLIATAYEKAGTPLTRVPPEIAGPADLARSPVLQRVGVYGDTRRAAVGRHAPAAPQILAGVGTLAGVTALTLATKRRIVT